MADRHGRDNDRDRGSRRDRWDRDRYEGTTGSQHSHDYARTGFGGGRWANRSTGPDIRPNRGFRRGEDERETYAGDSRDDHSSAGSRQDRGLDRGGVDRGVDRISRGSSDFDRLGREGFRGRGPQGDLRSDERITEDVNEALTDAHDVNAQNIQVNVQNGEVTLSGMVSSRHEKRRAEDIAESRTGVRDVINQIRITPERSDTQQTIQPESDRGR